MSVASAWEALTGDPLPLLLDERRPNLHWRVLTELIRRPADSPAVVRARGGADASEPVASLLAELQPDGSWSSTAGLWEPERGTAWRLLAAVQWGADPADPRLHEASARLLADAPGRSGFSLDEDEPPVPWLTARVLQAVAVLGWWRHQRVQEALAWLEEAAPVTDAGDWVRGRPGSSPEPCPVTPVALLAALTACGDERRSRLRDRAVESIGRMLARAEGAPALGHPNLDRSDTGEALWALATAGVGLPAGAHTALLELQRHQLDGGRWPRDVPVPAGLPVANVSSPGEPSRWITLRCAVAVLHFALEADLPRLFPQKPS